MKILKTIFFAALLMQSGFALAVPCRWVGASGGDVPPGAEAAGHEANGQALYIARADYKGGVYPGKTGAGLKGASIGWSGHEVIVTHYQVLVNPNECGMWEHAVGDEDPQQAIESGHEANGQGIFIARAAYKDGVHPGRIRSGLPGASIGWDGQEQSIPQYEVLVTPHHNDPQPQAGRQIPIQPCKWVDASGGKVPRGTQVGGMIDMSHPLYLVRVNYKGGVIPGWTGAGLKGASIGWDGREEIVKNYQVLVNPDRCGNWEMVTDKTVPPNAVAVGHEADGKPLYIARGLYKGGAIPGRVRPGMDGVSVGIHGKEESVWLYQIFVAPLP